MRFPEELDFGEKGEESLGWGLGIAGLGFFPFQEWPVHPPPPRRFWSRDASNPFFFWTLGEGESAGK